jgi:hypothetical protein
VRKKIVEDNMKEKFHTGSKVKIKNFDRGYDNRIGVLEKIESAKNNEWKVIFEWPLGGLAGHVVVSEDKLDLL